MPRRSGKTVCFVTGTRAEFGLMRGVLAAIDKHPKLTLQIIATGMHLDPTHGEGLASIGNAGFRVNRVIAWPANSGRDRLTTAQNTGTATSDLATAFSELQTDVVLVVGDRVEAFAAATAAQLSGLTLAHVHGGDRAAGQVDDSLRHAISKLAHLHFPATKRSARRLAKMGEDPWRIHRAGSPGVDHICAEAASATQVRKSIGLLRRQRYAVLVLHPVDADEELESRRARLVLRAAASVPYDHIVIVYPNNDPGSAGIVHTWDSLKDERVILRRDVARPVFLGLMRDAAVLIGNSSSGIIEAASFGTPVLDIGPRQQGREHSLNVHHVPYNSSRIRAELSRLWHRGNPIRFASSNVYGGSGAARRIVAVMTSLRVDDRLVRKLIAY